MGIRDYAVYALMYGLGLRVGEVHTLNLEDIDLKKKKITVNGKGNRQNILPIKNEMENILTEWLAVRNNFLNSDQDNALFISKKGHSLAIRTMMLSDMYNQPPPTF
jgi:integrase/recombinase XerC